MIKYAGSNANLVYMVLLNSKEALLFYLDNIDFKKIKKINWRIKQTQMSETSKYVDTPTYLIPYEKAFKKTDITEIVN